MQKHERLGVAVITSVAATYPELQVVTIKRGRHSTKVVITGPGGRRTIGLPSSPRDAVWAIRVAKIQAIAACRALTRKTSGDRFRKG